jgi:toxin-antitoxin system PIN domain toxin
LTYLLDVNVLIALMDPSSHFHEPAHNWFASIGKESWSTCPLTENGFIRIVGNPRYPNSPGSARLAAKSMAIFVAEPSHVFWPDDISLLDAAAFDLDRLATSSQVTDSYLVALAIAHGGKLATFDRRLLADAVRGGAQGLYLVGSQ